LYLNNKNYLVWINSFTKWHEVIEISKINSVYLIDKLKEIFGCFGLLNKIISDNGPQFCSSEFIEFSKQNGIVLYTLPPFHPATNGANENSVKEEYRKH
jgi:transposase InsO family protein